MADKEDCLIELHADGLGRAIEMRELHAVRKEAK